MASRRNSGYSRLPTDDSDAYDDDGGLKGRRNDPRFDYTPKALKKVPWKSIVLALARMRKKEASMANSEESVSGFNRKRAEGNDRSRDPKTLQKKVRHLNNAAKITTASYVQIMGTGLDTQDTSPSILLFFDNQRIVFNAGEGLQRFCVEHKIKLSKIDHIFLSRVCSETAGGLPGLLLTLATIGEMGMCVNVWGPSDLNILVEAMKLFVPNAAMLHTKTFGPCPNTEGIAVWDKHQFSGAIELINDEVVKISAILLPPICLTGLEEGRNGGGLIPGELSVVYVCELPEVQGKFFPEKAKALGLKPGPKYRALQLNESVKSDELDIMVHPSDVMDPPIPGPIILLVDCPTESHFQYLLSSRSLDAYYTIDSGNQFKGVKKVNCVIHLSPSSVVRTSEYKKWMSRFGDPQHIIAAHERKNVEIPVLKSSARVAARLNYLCPQFFPSSGFWPLDSRNGSVDQSNSSDEEFQGISAENLMKFNLRPYAQLGLDRSCIPSFMPQEKIIHELVEEIPEIKHAAEKVRSFWIDKSKVEDTTSINSDKVLAEEPFLNEKDIPNCLKNVTREDMEITLLGTGSMQPSKYRNVSAIYIHLFSKGGLLLDCGEGTLGQLKRRFGMEGADNAVRSLICIWISHIHADHHAGLTRILALRHDLLKGTPHEPVIVVGPRRLKRYLDAYSRLEELDMQFLDCNHTTESALDAFERLESNIKQSSMEGLEDPGTTEMNTGGQCNVAFPIMKKFAKCLQEAGLKDLISVPVVHCPQAFAVVLNASERINQDCEVIPGWKLVYSGDTRPCQELIKASRDATVLIHEATFEDSMMEEAVARNHSTTGEAIQVGESAGVYRIILTHFSQRYPKIPVFSDAYTHKTSIGFDLMSINMADLPVLPKVLPYLKLLFREEISMEEESDYVMEDARDAASIA
ncbi:hypothetical protein V2J09_005485 [Rumex salicifolius]